MSRIDSTCSSMHYRAPSRGGRYGSSPQTNAAGHPDRARIQPETVLESEYANRTVTSQRAGSGAVFAVRGSSAKSLWCLNLAESPEIRATFQRDSSRLHSEVRDLSPQPRNRVSVARLSRSWALRAAPFALTGAHVGQSGLTDPGDRSANKSRVSWPLRQGLRTRPVAPPSQQRSNVESRGSGRLQCNCIRKVSPTRKRCPCVLPVQFRRSAGAFTRTRSGEG